MKWWLWGIVAILLLLLIAWIAMAVQSQKAPDTLGLQGGMLRPCPASPNCVCSEDKGSASSVRPFQLSEGSWQRLKQVIRNEGGVIQQDGGDYLHATFSSKLFHFVDDLELRRDRQHGVIHVRSASRVGRSDFGVNRARVERLHQALAAVRHHGSSGE